MKQKARARKTTRELVPAASIVSSPALAAQPPQSVCRGAFSGGHQPDRAEQTVQSFAGAIGRNENFERMSHQMFLEFLRVRNQRGGVCSIYIIFLSKAVPVQGLHAARLLYRVRFSRLLSLLPPWRPTPFRKCDRERRRQICARSRGRARPTRAAGHAGYAENIRTSGIRPIRG
jgi:hypothetical protein